MSFGGGHPALKGDDRKALAAASQASYAAAELIRCLHEGDGLPEELVEKLLDAAKLVLEIAGDDITEDEGQVLGAISKFLGGWA